MDFFRKTLSPEIAKIFQFSYELFLCQALQHLCILEDFTENSITSFESFEYLALPKFSLDLHKNKSSFPIKLEGFLKNMAEKKNEDALYCYSEESDLISFLLKHESDVEICLMYLKYLIILFFFIHMIEL